MSLRLHNLKISLLVCLCYVLQFEWLLQIADTETLSRPLNAHHLYESLQDQHSVQAWQNFTCSVHEVKTFWEKHTCINKKTKKKRRELRVRAHVDTEVFAIVAKGTMPNIRLPPTFQYKDTLNSWKSESRNLRSRTAVAVTTVNDVDYVDDFPTPFMVFHKKDTGNFQQLAVKPIDHKGIVRVDFKSGDLLLDVKARRPDPNSLAKHLKCMYKNGELRDLHYICNDDGVHHMNLCRSPRFSKFYAERVCPEIPFSYQYPTISINNTILARPNNLSTVSYIPTPTWSGVPNFVNSFDNKAHIPFPNENFEPLMPSEEDIYQCFLDNHILRLILEDAHDVERAQQDSTDGSEHPMDNQHVSIDSGARPRTTVYRAGCQE